MWTSGHRSDGAAAAISYSFLPIATGALWQTKCLLQTEIDGVGLIVLRACVAQRQSKENNMKKLVSYLMSMLLVTLPSLSASAWAANQEKDEDRLKNCGTVLKEILDIPDDIPQDLLDKADCVVVFPSVLKAAFIVGGSYGRGAMSCRTGQDFKGPWGAPTMMALEGGSFGFQIGGQATDFVLLVMNERGASGILSSKVKLGADASIAAGPVGRDTSAETDATLRAEILSYSRARGLFAGVSLDGSTIRPDNDANKQIYGQKIPAKQIVLSGNLAIPPAAQGLTSTLDAKTPSRNPNYSPN
jgi:lipid-binding SYLF domain-containing protein